MAGVETIAARSRRADRAGRVEARLEWHGDKVRNHLDTCLEQRVHITTEFLKNNIVRNISIPVMKETGVRSGRMVVTERSKPGEFPRADAPLLMKTIFAVGPNREGNRIVGHVGTPLDYGAILETSKRLDRSFLVRTLTENRSAIEKILTGRIA